MNARKITDKKRYPDRISSKELLARAKRRMSYVTPDNAQKVLRHDRYWSVELMQLYLAECDRLRWVDPEAGWKMVRYGAELVSLIRVGQGPGELTSEVMQASWSTRALALEGDLAVWNGRYEAAARAFEKAVEVSSRRRIKVAAAGDLQRRRAAYAMALGDFDRCRRRLVQAIELLRRLDPGPELAEALLLSGFLGRPGNGLVGLAEALACSRPKGTVAEGIFDGALALLMERLQEPRITFEEYEAILGWLYLARKRWFARQSKTVRKMSLMWAEGRALSCLGLGRLAQRRLSRAWKGLGDLKESTAFGLIALDLAGVQIGHDERPAALRALGDTRALLERLDAEEMAQELARVDNLSLTELVEIRAAVAAARLPRAATFYPPALASEP